LRTVSVLVARESGTKWGRLRIAGLPAGTLFSDDNPEEDADWLAPPGSGSVIVVLATDAPLLPGQCKALARRAPIGLARTGTTGSHFSGDIFLAFSTANSNALASTFPAPARDGGYRQIRFLPWGHIDPFYTAAVQATEEAVINCLTAAETMLGRDDHRSPGLPVDRLAELTMHTAQIPAATRA
jgi:D-aminopeptidase